MVQGAQRLWRWKNSINRGEGVMEDHLGDITYLMRVPPWTIGGWQGAWLKDFIWTLKTKYSPLWVLGIHLPLEHPWLVTFYVLNLIFDEACMPMIRPCEGHVRYLDFWLILVWLACQVSAMFGWPWTCFDFWIWNFVNLCLGCAWFGHTLSLVFVKVESKWSLLIRCQNRGG